jgi:hypothetical protein
VDLRLMGRCPVFARRGGGRGWPGWPLRSIWPAPGWRSGSARRGRARAGVAGPISIRAGPDHRQWQPSGAGGQSGGGAVSRAWGRGEPLAGPPHADFAFADLATGERWTLRINDGPVPWWVLCRAAACRVRGWPIICRWPAC